MLVFAKIIVVKFKISNLATYWEAELLCPLIFEDLFLINGCRQFHAGDVISISVTSLWGKGRGLLEPGILPWTQDGVFCLTG